MRLLFYLSICGEGFNIFWIVFHMRKATFIRVSRKSFVIILTSLPLYVKVTHFLGVMRQHVYFVFVFSGEVLIKFMSYSLCSMFLMVFFSKSFFSFCFPFCVTGYVCNQFVREKLVFQFQHQLIHIHESEFELNIIEDTPSWNFVFPQNQRY
jgi:hypothetical protein